MADVIEEWSTVPLIIWEEQRLRRKKNEWMNEMELVKSYQIMINEWNFFACAQLCHESENEGLKSRFVLSTDSFAWLIFVVRQKCQWMRFLYMMMLMKKKSRSTCLPPSVDSNQEKDERTWDSIDIILRLCHDSDNLFFYRTNVMSVFPHF